MIIIKTAVSALLWRLPHYLPIKEEKIKSFRAGFCMAEAIAVLCTECAWMYSVVFGEITGFLMLTLTVAGSLLLFCLLSGKTSSVLLTALYLFFSSEKSEYNPAPESIINTSAGILRIGIAGVNEAKGKRWIILCLSVLAGGMLSISDASLPTAFRAIACSALLYGASRNISCEMPCIAGCACACILAYF